MSARYTSPELSRRLREAGLEQDRTDGQLRVYFEWCSCPYKGSPEAQLKAAGIHICKHRDEAGYDGNSTPCRHASHVRALDLTDVLEDLRRHDLVVHMSVGKETFLSALPCARFNGAHNMAEHVEAVEAAGLVLCQLLEARR